MTTIWKRSLSMFLALVMVFGMLPMTVFAEDSEETDCEHVNRTTTTVAATCTEAGYKTETCDACGVEVSREQTEDATGHTAGADATCTAAQICTICGTELVAATGHSYGEDGICTVCGEAKPAETEPESTTAPAEGGETCTHASTTTTTVDATCTADGSTTVVCDDCGATVSTTVIPAGHTPGAAATCTDLQVCAVCGDELAAATGHDFGEDDAAATCAVCGAENANYVALEEEVTVSTLAELLAALAAESELPIEGEIGVEDSIF